ILNGDMRLNIHLVGVIAGIVMIGSIGGFLMTGIRDGDDLRRAGTDIRVFFLGLLLWLIGSIGVLAGRLIKAVISREREFLADAAALSAQGSPVVSELVSPLYAPRKAAPAASGPRNAAGIAGSMVESIGNPSSAHLDHARGMLEAIPAEIRAAVGHEEGAQA